MPRLAGHHVHLLLERPVDLLHAEAAVGAADGPVGVDADGVAPDVGELVGAAAGVAGRAHHVDAVAAVAAAVPQVVHLLRLHLAVSSTPVTSVAVSPWRTTVA